MTRRRSVRDRKRRNKMRRDPDLHRLDRDFMEAVKLLPPNVEFPVDITLSNGRTIRFAVSAPRGTVNTVD